MMKKTLMFAVLPAAVMTLCSSCGLVFSKLAPAIGDAGEQLLQSEFLQPSQAEEHQQTASAGSTAEASDGQADVTGVWHAEMDYTKALKGPLEETLGDYLPYFDEMPPLNVIMVLELGQNGEENAYRLFFDGDTVNGMADGYLGWLTKGFAAFARANGALTDGEDLSDEELVSLMNMDLEDMRAQLTEAFDAESAGTYVFEDGVITLENDELYAVYRGDSDTLAMDAEGEADGLIADLLPLVFSR